MINIPHALFSKYGTMLANKAVPLSSCHHYNKWLRYYLDFCHKYKQSYSDDGSLEKFIEKLREKNQSPEQRKQAVQAVSLVLRDVAIQDSKCNGQPHRNVCFSTKRRRDCVQTVTAAASCGAKIRGQYADYCQEGV